MQNKKIDKLYARFIRPIKKEDSVFFYCEDCKEYKEELGRGYDLWGKSPGRVECKCGFVYRF